MRLIGLRRGAGALVALLVAGAAAAPAQAQAPASKPAEPRPFRSAMARVVDNLAAQLGPLADDALVVSGPLAAAPLSPRSAELSALVAAQLAGRLGPSVRAHAAPGSLAEARGIARNASRLVYVSLSLRDGRLAATADVYPIPSNVWARVRDPEPGPVVHAFAESPIDAEVRGYLAPVPLAAVSITRARAAERDVVAIACGDLDDDRSLEILSASRHRISTMRLRGGGPVLLRSRAWSELGGVAPKPLREPIGFATIGGDEAPRYADLSLSDRAASVRLDAQLNLVGSWPLITVPDGARAACVRASSTALAGPLISCDGGAGRVGALASRALFDAYASARVVSRRGEPSSIYAVREGSTVRLSDDRGGSIQVEGVGAQLALGDLDEDGDPELIASLDVADARLDQIVVRSWRRDAKPPALVELFRVPAAAGVRALGVCPPDGLGRAPFVVATSDELWVVR